MKKTLFLFLLILMPSNSLGSTYRFNRIFEDQYGWFELIYESTNNTEGLLGFSNRSDFYNETWEINGEPYQTQHVDMGYTFYFDASVISFSISSVSTRNVSVCWMDLPDHPYDINIRTQLRIFNETMKIGVAGINIDNYDCMQEEAYNNAYIHDDDAPFPISLDKKEILFFAICSLVIRKKIKNHKRGRRGGAGL